MKKAKENWIGEQCSETEENLRKTNSKREYQLGIHGLDHCETGESDYCPRSFRKMPHRRATDNEPMDRGSELYNYKKFFRSRHWK